MYELTLNNLDFSHKYDEHIKVDNDFTKHMHTNCEILFLIKGDVSYNVEASVKKLRPFDIVFIKPGNFHYGTVSQDTPYERYVFKFPLSYVPQHLQSTILHIGPFLGRHENLMFLMKESDYISKKYKPIDQEILFKGFIERVCIELCNEDLHHSSSETMDIPDVVAQTLEYIKNHITENITISKIADELHFSVSYLSTQFEKYSNTSLMKYINTKKIISADEEISFGMLTPKQAAIKYGYQEYSTFYRNYLSIIGHSPTKEKETKQ